MPHLKLLSNLFPRNIVFYRPFVEIKNHVRATSGSSPYYIRMNNRLKFEMCMTNIWHNIIFCWKTHIDLYFKVVTILHRSLNSQHVGTYSYFNLNIFRTTRNFVIKFWRHAQKDMLNHLKHIFSVISYKTLNELAILIYFPSYLSIIAPYLKSNMFTDNIVLECLTFMHRVPSVRVSNIGRDTCYFDWYLRAFLQPFRANTGTALPSYSTAVSFRISSN